MELLIGTGIILVVIALGVNLFHPNHVQHGTEEGKCTTHEHSWGNGHMEVDHPRKMVEYVEDCAYGCGSSRRTDVHDIHEKGPRCS